MMPSRTTLGLWLCTLGLASAATARERANDTSSSSSEPLATIDKALLDKTVAYAEKMKVDGLVQRVRAMDADALHSVAADIDDRTAGVEIWRALADGPEKHAESAYALGETYYSGSDDKGASKRALKYYRMAAGGDDGDDDVPHQGALYGAARSLVNLNYFSPAMDYFRRCVHVEDKHPDAASPEITKGCHDGYESLRDKIMEYNPIPGGITALVNMFPHASLDGFPHPDSKEEKIWNAAAENLEAYSQLLRGIHDQSKEKALIVAAHDALEKLKRKYGGGRGMSALQEHLLKSMLGRTGAIVRNLVGDHDEL